MRLRREPLSFTEQQWQVLEVLVASANKLVSRPMLHDALRLRGIALSDTALSYRIHALRRKLESTRLAIRAVHGLGYSLDTTDANPRRRR